MSVRIELLYFDQCPNYERYLPRLRRLLDEEAPGAEVALRRVETDRAAVEARFLGSPSVRVNGVDVEPGADDRADFGLKCRLYRSEEGLSGIPVDAWVRAAVAAARGG